MEIGQGVITQRANTAIDMVLARVTQEIELSWYFEHNLKKLAQTLEKMNAILHNRSAVAAETSTGAVQLWLRGLEDIAYDAENMLDVLAFEKVRQKLAMKLSFSKRLHLLFSPSNPVLIRRKMGRWVQRIDSAIQKAYQEAHTLGLRPADLPSSPAGGASAADEIVLRQIREIPDTSFVVGRADDKAKLVDMLCNPRTDDLSVVAIIGLGGLGKTVLAHEVYDDEQVKSHFSERIWITVSRDFKIKEILNGMVGFIKKSKFDCESVELTVQALSEHLFGRGYMLVLDDVWNTHQDTWDTLRNALRRISGSADSKILVTTRDRGVAETMHASVSHYLPELSEDDSWSLFKRLAFANWPSDHSSVLKEIGKRIVVKCRGVPLAIKTIGGLLNSKKRAHEWEIIEKSGVWDVPQDKAGILPSLKLSYTYLPSPLKKCFSFLTLYQKATNWSKKYLICMWMANGFLQQPPDGFLTMEDIGEEYFDMLLKISFLQEYDRTDFGEIARFTMHDLVHDLATYVGKHECLCLDLNAGGIKGHNVEKVKHLRLAGQSSSFSDVLMLGSLRTLVSHCYFPEEVLLHVKYLRVLDLRNMNLKELPKSISGWKCLKYLNLSGNLFKVLPESIMELYNLQTLNLFRCPNLIRIPEGFGNLVNLRHFLVERFLELPTGVEKLSYAQTLTPLMVREGGFQITELRDLHHLSGVLHIGGLELVKTKQDAKMANLSEKSRVEQLGLHWTPGTKEGQSKDLDEEIMDGLYPNPHLRHLHVEGYGSKKFPVWVMRMDVSKALNCQSQQLLYNLTKIELLNCSRCEQLPTMGHLPCLKFLRISEMESLKQIGTEFYCCDEIISRPSNDPKPWFPKLEQLRLNQLDNLEEWCEPEPTETLFITAFPCLELLTLEFCPKLRKTPNKFPSLKEFTAKGIGSGLPVSRIIGSNTTLHALEVKKVLELEILPEQLTQCSSLRTLRIHGCPMLTCLPDLSGLTSLREVGIAGNDSLTSLPSGLKNCSSLEVLKFCICYKSRPVSVDLSGLRRLSCLGIPGQTGLITQPPYWLLNGLPRLQQLSIGMYLELDHFPDLTPLLNITSLVTLFLMGWIKLQSRTLPVQLQHFTRLTGLVIISLRDLEALPEWLQNLSSLEMLSLSSCPKLKSLPSLDAMKRLTKLRFMAIQECPMLASRVKVNGTEHHKIAHIQVRLLKPGAVI